jgi:hypothetical protein
MTWYLQIQDKDYNVLYLNCELGTYKKYTKRIENAAEKVVRLFPSAKRWEVRTTPYTSRVVM